MEAVVKIIKGPDSGVSMPVTPGETLIGRNPKAPIRLTHGSVSFDHAIISRSGDDFYIENLSANGTLLNDVRLAAKSKLRIKDEITLSPDVVLRFEAAPGHEPGLLANRTVLMALVALLLLAIIGFVSYDSMNTPPVDNWNNAHRELHAWVKSEVAAKRINKQVEVLLDQAWRLDAAGDYRTSKNVWLNLNVLLATPQHQYQFTQASQDHRGALEVLLKPKKNSPVLTDDQRAAAFEQFVQRRLRFAMRLGAGEAPTMGLQR